MNDTELDRLLDAWETPPPSSSLRARVRAGFPRDERRGFRFSLRWVLAAAVLSVTLAIAAGQGGGNSLDQFFASFRLARLQILLLRWFQPEAYEAYEALSIREKICGSQPKIYVDNQLLETPQYGSWHAATIWIEVPGEGMYFFSTYNGGVSSFKEAGKAHDNILEFHAGAKHVLIECSAPITTRDRPVFILRKQ